MRVLVTGGAGFIGSHIIALLLSRGHAVLCVDNHENADIRVHDRLYLLTGRRHEVEDMDLRQRDRLVAVTRNFRPDAVVHLAGVKSVDESVADPLDYYDRNVGSSLSLLHAMQLADVNRIVFSSSATVYGEPAYLPVDEAHPLSPTNPYGRTKQHIESMLMDQAASNPRFSAALLRYFNPVGCHPSGLIGEMSSAPPRNLMPIVARVAQGLMPEVLVTGNDYPTPDGTGLRDYIHVMDLAQAHLMAIDWSARERGATPFNIGLGKGVTVLQLIRAFERASGRKVAYRFAPRRPGDIAQSYANADRAQKILGWQPAHDLDDMCESVWKWQVSQTARSAAFPWSRAQPATARTDEETQSPRP